MGYKNISVELAPSTVGEVRECMENIRRKLPFLITLSKAERRHLFKMGDKSLAFVENSLTVARNHPEALPANFDYLEFNRDVGLMEGLIEVEMELDKLRAEVNDT